MTINIPTPRIDSIDNRTSDSEITGFFSTLFSLGIYSFTGNPTKITEPPKIKKTKIDLNFIKNCTDFLINKPLQELYCFLSSKNLIFERIYYPG